MHGALYQHDHIVHFYHLHALDWVDVVSALKADPAKTAALSDNVSNAPWGGTVYFKNVQQRLKTFVGQRATRPVLERLLGAPGLQAPARSQPDGDRALHRGAAPAGQGRAHARDLRRQQEPAPAAPGGGRGHLRQRSHARPDRRVPVHHQGNSGLHQERGTSRICWRWPRSTRTVGAIGGTTNFLAWGDFPQTEKEPDSLFMPRGVVMKRDFANVKDGRPGQGERARRPVLV